MNGQKLTAWTKIKYAFAGLGGGMNDLCIDILLLPFYTEIVGIAPAIAGWVALAAGVWDAVTDPILGSISDGTRTRLGRRRPFFLVGAIPLGFSFWWLFNPAIHNLALSFLLAFLLYRLSLTMVLIPHFAMGAEMSTDYDERTSVMGYNRSFWIIGLLGGVAVPLILLEAIPDKTQAYNLIGLILGAFITFSVLVTFFGTRENPKNWLTAKPVNYLKGLGILFRNKPYLIAQVSYLLYHTAAAIPNTLLIYFAIHWMRIGESAALTAIPVYMLTALASIPVWVKVTARINKKRAFIASLFFSFAGAMLCLAIPPGGLALLLIILGVAGIGYGGMMTIPAATLADIVDIDEVQTGDRREGLYFGMWDFVRKLCSNLGKWAPMIGLAYLGYAPAAEAQSPVVVSGIRYMFSVGPAVLYIIAALIMFTFPMDREMYKRVRAELDARKLAAAADGR